MKDSRLLYVGENNVWHIDAKLDRDTNELKVYRVYGDITDKQEYSRRLGTG